MTSTDSSAPPMAISADGQNKVNNMGSYVHVQCGKFSVLHQVHIKSLYNALVCDLHATTVLCTYIVLSVHAHGV